MAYNLETEGGKPSDRTEESAAHKESSVQGADMTLKDVQNLNKPDRTAQHTVEREVGHLELTDKDCKKTGDCPESPRSRERDAEREADKVADQYGADVSVHEKNGKMVYDYSYKDQSGKRHELFSTTDNPCEANTRLEQMQREKITETECKYQVDISRNGERRKISDGDNTGSREMRAPTFGELDSLNEALRTSEPSNKTSDGKPLKISYANENIENNDAVSAYRSDNDGLVIDKDKKADANVMRHELAHQGDDRVRPDGSSAQQDYYNELGWTKTENDDWALRTKDGKLYHQDEPGGEWTRVNKEGNEVDANGNEFHWYTNNVKRDHISNDEMKERAEVTPETWYFPTPKEMHADAMRDFRAGGQQRTEMQLTNPQLYGIAKQADQQEITAAYGTNSSGEPLKIRAYDGSIVDNTAANRAEIASEEMNPWLQQIKVA
jgi:hypothetical protein